MFVVLFLFDVYCRHTIIILRCLSLTKVAEQIDYPRFNWLMGVIFFFSVLESFRNHAATGGLPPTAKTSFQSCLFLEAVFSPSIFLDKAQLDIVVLHCCML